MTGYTEAEEKELEKLHDDLRALSKKYKQNGIIEASSFTRQFLYFGLMAILEQDIPLQDKIHFIQDTIEQTVRAYIEDVVL